MSPLQGSKIISINLFSPGLRPGLNDDALSGLWYYYEPCSINSMKFKIFAFTAFGKFSLNESKRISRRNVCDRNTR